eukprot:gene7391-10072_t
MDQTAIIEDQPKRKVVQFSINTPHVALTPALKNGLTPAFKSLEQRSNASVAPPSSLFRPNYEDILKRVSVVIHNHIQMWEQRIATFVKTPTADNEQFIIQMNKFAEDLFITPQYVYQFVRAPISRVGFLYGIKKLSGDIAIPELSVVHEFISNLFIKAQLSAECSIVCLIYVERLMEVANVPLVGKNWRPILLCGLLLASKVWQDLSSWNIEISQVYPQFSLKSINKIEMVFCKEIQWMLYISRTAYAKYYFALRSLTEKSDFRRNYNIMVISAPGENIIEQRSGEIQQSLFSKSF